MAPREALFVKLLDLLLFNWNHVNLFQHFKIRLILWSPWKIYFLVWTHAKTRKHQPKYSQPLIQWSTLKTYLQKHFLVSWRKHGQTSFRNCGWQPKQNTTSAPSTTRSIVRSLCNSCILWPSDLAQIEWTLEALRNALYKFKTYLLTSWSLYHCQVMVNLANKHTNKQTNKQMKQYFTDYFQVEVINLLRLNDEAKLRTDLSEFRSSCKMGSWLLLIPVWLTISSTACWALSNERQAKYTFAPVCTTVNVSVTVSYNSFSGKSGIVEFNVPLDTL